MPDEICIFDASPCLPAGAPCSLQDMGIMGSDHDDHCNEMGCVSPPCTDCVDGAIQEQCGGDSSSCPDGFSMYGRRSNAVMVPSRPALLHRFQG